MKKNYWGSRGLATLTAWAVVGVAVAQQTTPQGSEKLSIHIEAQPMAQALSELGDQTGLSIIVASAATDGVKAPAVEGSYTAREALRKILDDTGLRAEYLSKTTVAVRVAQSNDSQESKAPKDSHQNSAVAPQSTPPRRMQDGADTDQVSPDQNSTPSSSGKPQGANERGIPEILVRGSRSLNMDIVRTEDDVQPYVVFKHEELQESSAANVAEFLQQRLSMASSSTVNSQASSGQSASGNSSLVQLRGLSGSNTLILIDGRRAPSLQLAGTPGQPDVNGIPLSAIERIEVLPTSASGIYGGNATGGVINIVLRRDYSGVEAQATYGNTFRSDSDLKRVELTAGTSLEGGKTTVFLAASYQESGGLLVEDRNLLQQARAMIIANNPAAYFGSAIPPLGATANIRSATVIGGVTQNLTLKNGTPLNSPIAYVPVGYAGPATDGGSAFLSTAGQYNETLANTAAPSGGKLASLLNAPTVESVMASVQREFGEHVRAFIDLSADDDLGYFLSSGSNTFFAIPSSSPTNPFKQAIMVSTSALALSQPFTQDQNNRSATGGVVVSLPHGWEAGADYTWGRGRTSYSLPAGSTAAGSTAVASGVLNVLQDTNQHPLDAAAYTQPLYVFGPAYSTLEDLVVRGAGPIMELPGGPLTVSVQVESRHDIFSDAYATGAGHFYYPGRSQSVNSAFAEVRAPIIGQGNELPALHLLEIQLAGRWDKYVVNGSTGIITLPAAPNTVVATTTDRVTSSNPTVGFRYEPTSDVLLRGSYGTGFLPPDTSQLVPSPPSPLTAQAAATVVDPRRGSEPLGLHGTVTRIAGGNPDLLPETSRTLSAGVVLTPSFMRGLRVSVDWTKIDKADNIMSLGFNQNLINNEAFLPGAIVRGPVPANDPYGVGPIVQVDTGLLNVARTHIEDLDFELDYATPESWLGTFDVSAGATHQIHLEQQLSALAPVVENSGLIYTGGLEWKGAGTVRWRRGGWSIAWTARYYSSYWANVSHTSDPYLRSAAIPSQTYHDLYASYRFRGAKSRLLNNTEIALGITNMFDKEPPIVPVGGVLGFSGWGDAALAKYALTIRKSF